MDSFSFAKFKHKQIGQRDHSFKYVLLLNNEEECMLEERTILNFKSYKKSQRDQLMAVVNVLMFRFL